MNLPRLLALAVSCLFARPGLAAEPTAPPAISSPAADSAATPSTAAVAEVWAPAGFKASRGVHLTAWAAGSSKARRKFLDHMRGTVLNTIVIPLKETDGFVYISGVEKARSYGTTDIAIADPESMMRDFKGAGLYTIARIAVFNDDRLARQRPEWAVHRPDGSLWLTDKGAAWLDPYRREVWEYILDVAQRAARLGFDEIQFDYVRFPSDGDTSLCRYSRADHNRRAAVEDLRDFLRYADERLKPENAKMSVAIFGLTTTSKTDMGIGQELTAMAGFVDYISPMMYPSHYAHGEYGLKNPNREPYKTIYRGLRDAVGRLRNDSYKLRPYLQDFSLGVHYGPTQVIAQILAAKRDGVDSWLLWNAANRYTWDALTPRNGSPLRFDR